MAEGVASLKELEDGTYSIDDLADLNEWLDLRAEAQAEAAREART